MINTQPEWDSPSSPDAPYKIMIIDDHDCIIDALSSRLGTMEEYKVVATAQYAEEARQHICGEIDLVIMDIRLPLRRGMKIQHDGGIDLAVEFHKKYPKLEILIFSGEDNIELVQRARAAGAEGYLLKSNGSSRLKEAISSLRDGRRYTDPDLPRIPRRSPIEELTECQKNILRHLAQHKSRKQIARDLNVEHVTVNCHCKNIKARLNINSAQELLKIAIEYYGENR
jgi:DNA-binding NarL/FixJ family response regulator